MTNKLTIKLTGEQQKQIQDLTGKSVTELHLNLVSAGGLSDDDLDQVTGGVSEIVITKTQDKSSTNLS